MAYGYIQTADNVAKQLKELNRDYFGRKTWGNLYGNVDYQRQSALSDLTYDYETQVAKAYYSSHQQKSMIANSALGSGFKEQAQVDMDLALQEAFSSYRQKYLSSAAKIEESAFAATSQIDALLQQEAQNYVDYEQSAYSYLQSLYDRAYPTDGTMSDSNLEKMFAEDPNWSKYIVTNPDGTKGLMTEQELRERNYDMDNAGQGTLNRTGVDFYDQMLNSLSQEGGKYGFHQWLSEENPKLYEWSQSDDLYNYTEAGSRMGSFKKMMGLQSIDDEYKFIENFGGLTQEEIKSNVQSFVNNVTENTGKSADTTSILKAYSGGLDSLEEYIDKLNLTPEQNDALETVISTARKTINEVDVKDTTDHWLWPELVEMAKHDWKKLEANQEAGHGIPGIIMDTGVLVMDLVFTAFFAPTSNEVIDARAAERENYNKEYVKKVEQKYVDVMALLASYAK